MEFFWILSTYRDSEVREVKYRTCFDNNNQSLILQAEVTLSITLYAIIVFTDNVIIKKLFYFPSTFAEWF